jgi:hypothetical protein
MLYSGGFAAVAGLKAVGAPNLAELLVYDSTRLFLILNGALSSVDLSNQWRFEYDATTLRVKSRVAVGCPAPAKTIRKWGGAAPLAQAVAPNSGPAAGGTAVTVSGSRLTGATGVTFGGVAATGVSVTNDTTVACTTPAHAAGAVDVAVTTPDGTGTKTGGFTYT